MLKHPHRKTYLLIGVMVVCGPIGNLLLAKAMRQIGNIRFWPPAELLATLPKIISSPTLWIGIVLLITFTVAYMLALSLADYSFVQPAAAMGYVIIAVLGVTVLKERVSLLHWVGIGVICLGISFIRGTDPRTTVSRR